MKSENNRTDVDELPDVENERPTNPVPNAVVLAEATEVAQRAAIFLMACLFVLFGLVVLGLIAAVNHMPDLVFYFINGVIVVIYLVILHSGASLPSYGERYCRECGSW